MYSYLIRPKHSALVFFIYIRFQMNIIWYEQTNWTNNTINMPDESTCNFITTKYDDKHVVRTRAYSILIRPTHVRCTNISCVSFLDRYYNSFPFNWKHLSFILHKSITSTWKSHDMHLKVTWPCHCLIRQNFNSNVNFLLCTFPKF